MNFMAGISSINLHPKIAPANKIGDAIAAAKAARHEGILEVLEGQPKVTIEELARRLNYPESLMRNDVTILINKGKLRDSWDGKQRFIRRSIL